MEKPALTFRVFQGSNLVGRETVRRDVVKIGKDPKSHLRVDCDLAARMHAVIEVASTEDVTLIDLGNEPGTMVNGKRVNKCRVRAGDRIQIGTVTLELESIQTPVSAPPPAPLPVAAFAVPAMDIPAPIFHQLAPNNPFLAPVSVAAPAVPQTSGSVTDGYAMIKSGPAVHSEEVEDAHLAAIEVKVRWGTNVLHVAHLSPPRSFFVGESSAKGETCDFLLPADVLGATRAPVVVDRGGHAWLIVPAGATGTLEVPGQGAEALANLVACGRANVSTEVSGAYEIELLQGARAEMALASGGIVFEVSTVAAGKKIVSGLLAGLEASAYKQIGLSLFAHLGMVASLAFFMPRMGADDTEAIDRDFMARMLHAADANQIKEQEEQDQNQSSDAPSGGEGQRAQGAEGQMGSQQSTAQNRHYTIAGPQDADPKMARERALREAAEFGMIGLLAQQTGSVNVPTAIWGEDRAVGHDSANHLGSMWGAEAGDAWGIGGLGLSGNEEGGGGVGVGIGIDRVGTLGHGGGCISTPDKPCGIGIGPGGEGIGHGYKPGRAHVPTARMPRQGDPTINGHLPAEVIQRIVRQNFGRFRSCYEGALRTNPSLQGRVAIKFAIARDGSVSTASDAGSDLPDQQVISCVARSFMNLSFPQPEGGIVTVQYPLIFSPAD